MVRRRSQARILIPYILSIVFTIGMLVMWVIYVVNSVSRVRELAGGFGVHQAGAHWIILTVGCVLFGLMITGITFLLAQGLAELRYSRAQEEFISNITHEMKSPLAAIKLHSQTLKSQELRVDEKNSSLNFVLTEVERMEDLVDNVLESSRVSRKNFRLQIEVIPLHEYFADFEGKTRAKVEALGFRYGSKIKGHGFIEADESALDRILDNLVDNALKFSKTGGEVCCALSFEGEWARIAVVDQGIGIPQNEIKRIFDRFYQIGREITHRKRGAGLGLYIVSQLVHRMSGTIEAESTDGEPGTQFTLMFPLISEGRDRF